MTLRVHVRRGLSVEELMTAGPRVRDAAGAYAVRCVLGPRPALVDIRLVMLDPIAGTRMSVITPPAATVSVPPVVRRQPTSTPAVVLGRGEDGRPVVFDPTDAWHVAMQGATRSGKSALSRPRLTPWVGRSRVNWQRQRRRGLIAASLLSGPLRTGQSF